jgi:hypothetical protein
MGFEIAFREFGDLLRERLSLGILTTEDTIRYTLYAALTASGGLKHSDLILEYPHPALPRAKVDTVVTAGVGREAAAFEFKYDRANPGGSNQNRTQRAAKALIDLFRLVRVPEDVAAAKYFVYVTDREMAAYFRNPVNRLHELFELAEGAQHALGRDGFQGYARTLTTLVGPFTSECIVERVFADDELPGDHCVRIFRVVAPQASDQAISR